MRSLPRTPTTAPLSKPAVQVGLPTLDVHVREDIAESRARFHAAVLTENVKRSNFNYIEEAPVLQQMLEMTNGNQTQASEKLQKSKQWFSQRIGLLRLSEEMQALVILAISRRSMTCGCTRSCHPASSLPRGRLAGRNPLRPQLPRPRAHERAPMPAPKAESVYTAVYTSSGSGAGSEQPVPHTEEPLSVESQNTPSPRNLARPCAARRRS
ncbi:ParB/RepB/Spo0J family partition protein [Streptomyces gelaticus]|uniref:ParB/RepB/Spo0J family partition protein n=1 Tax=Streptomyces gelaticus TaxID=285446 RepID=UPI004032BEA3